MVLQLVLPVVRKGVLCAVRMRMVAATVTESGLQAAARHPSAVFTARDDAVAWHSAMHHGAMPLHVFIAARTNVQLLLGRSTAACHATMLAASVMRLLAFATPGWRSKKLAV